MKKILSLLLISTIVFVSGCFASFFAMDEMQYYNTYIDYINQLTDDLDYSMDDYLASVPEEIDPEADIEFYGTYYSTAIANLEYAQVDLSAKDMKIADNEKQLAVEKAAYDFFAALANFYATYYDAAAFYTEDGHKDDVDAAYALDKKVVSNYHIAATAQLELLNVISGYQIDYTGDLNEDTNDPLEKISISMTLIYRAADDLVYALSYWDFEDPDLDTIESLYNTLIETHTKEAAEVDALYTDKYDTVFDAFQVSYLGILTSFEEEVAKIIKDGRAGTITSENSSDYDTAFDYYDQLVGVHNSIIDMLSFDF